MTTDTPPSAGWRDFPRYPDPAIEILDKRFEPYRIFSAAVERLYTGCRWAEGPVWFGDGRYLQWSDIPNNRILKWEEETAQVSVWKKPTDFANGNTRDRQGRLITCEHGGRRVIRTEYDGSVTVIMDRCVKIEHARLFGGLGWFGVNTGVISARRPLPPH